MWTPVGHLLTLGMEVGMGLRGGKNKRERTERRKSLKNLSLAKAAEVKIKCILFKTFHVVFFLILNK